VKKDFKCLCENETRGQIQHSLANAGVSISCLNCGRLYIFRYPDMIAYELYTPEIVNNFDENLKDYLNRSNPDRSKPCVWEVYNHGLEMGNCGHERCNFHSIRFTTDCLNRHLCIYFEAVAEEEVDPNINLDDVSTIDLIEELHRREK